MKNRLLIYSKRTTPFLWILLMSILLSASSCGKEKVVEPEPDLPPLTTTGRMTFGCYVNGEPWVAEVPPFQPYHNNTGGGLHYYLDSLFILFGQLMNDGRFETMSLNFKINPYNLLPSSYDLIYKDFSYVNFNNSCNDQEGDYRYELDTTYINNKLEVIHLDLEKRIISGIFEMRTISLQCRDTVLITDGRFDTTFSITE